MVVQSVERTVPMKVVVWVAWKAETMVACSVANLGQPWVEQKAVCSA